MVTCPSPDSRRFSLIIQSVTTNLRGWRDNAGTFLPEAFLSGEHQLAWVFRPPSGTGVCEMYVDGVLVDNSTVWTIAGAGADTTSLSGALNTPIKCDMDFFAWYTDAHDAGTVYDFYQFGLAVWGQ